MPDSVGAAPKLRAGTSLRPRIWILVISAVLLVFVFHRTPNESFHPVGDECIVHFTGRIADLTRCASIEQLDEFSLAFVEFDDQGAYFDQAQAFAAFQLIRESLDSSYSGVQVFVFVHGWTHNAETSDPNVVQFRDFLNRMTRQYAPQKVVGVYVGWPGETLRFPLDVLTFWSRKAAAHRVASGAVQEFFATLQQVKNDQEIAVRQQLSLTPPPKIYVIGHSFGGLIVFQATSQSFALRYGGDVLLTRGAPRVAGFGDLVILINPAIEATRFSSLHALSKEYPNDPFYSPVMVTVASQTDSATKILFPMGVLAGTLITHQLRSNEWRDSITTIGNAESFLTHNASLEPSGKVTVCERPHAFSQRKAPFWFLTASDTLVDGHSDLNGEKLFALFSTLQREIQSKRFGGLRSCRQLEHQ